MNKDIQHNERVLMRMQKELEPLKRKETEAIRLWTLAYHKVLAAQKKLQERRKKGLTTNPIDTKGVVNKTVLRFWETMDGWDARSKELTRKRDEARAAMEAKKKEIQQQEQLLSTLLHAHRLQLEKTDDIVSKVFLLNDGVVSSLELMDQFLKTEIFPQLHEKGTQKAIENSTSTKKVVIMTNSINIMDVAMVNEAKQEIDAFFLRINPTKEVRPEDETIAMLTELLKELWVVKMRVKAGPHLSKFLAMELNAEKFPELRKAQKLLASATNYSRSGLYVRLYTRANNKDTWQPVRQS